MIVSFCKDTVITFREEGGILSKKRYYIQGVDQLNQLVETPASKERTEKNRYVINTIISVISAVAAIIGAVASVIVLCRG